MTERLVKLFDKLPDDVDCVMITSDINRRYFTNMKSSAGIVIAFKEKAYLLIDFRYIEKAKKIVEGIQVVEQKNYYSQITEILKKNNAKSVAIESKTMTVSQLALWKNKLPTNLKIIETDMLSNQIDLLRAVKDETEIEYIKKAQEIAEIAFNSILKFIKVGVTERQIALELDRVMLENGAEAISFDTIALAGQNTSMPHGVPSDKKVQNGEFVLMDFGAVYNGYHSDMTRTVCVGEPTEEMLKVYNIVLEAQIKSLEFAKAGIKGLELDKIARDIISENGYEDCFGHSLGHSVGLEIHENPNASPNSSVILKSGNIITIEPGIYIAGKFGVRIEDFVILTENSSQNLTKCEKNIIYL